jgi:putative tricarboxylic transport membrane protein
MFDLLAAGVVEVLQWKYLVPLFLGTMVGVIGGALPGVTITMTIIVILPFTFGLDPLQGLAAMTGVYVGGSAGGLVTACLLGIPGTPSAIATTFDGFPMARNGEPGRAVWLGTWSSFFGGLIGGAFLIAATAPLARLALEFGPWEYFALFVLALSMVAGLTEESLAKGLLAGGVGLVITIIGGDPIMGVPRLHFDTEFLRNGFPFLPVLVGIFAFAQVMTETESMGRRAVAGGNRSAVVPSLLVSHLKVVWEIVSRPFLLLWSSFIGVVIGVLPAIGGSAANMMAYDQAKKLSKTPERFGTGTPEGIIASESSNNANVGGSLVTIMAFGIPGDAVTAVMLGAMTIHGIQSGPLFMTQQSKLAYGIFGAYMVSLVLMVLIIWIAARPMLAIGRVPKSVLIPIVLVLCVIGAYALNNTMGNVHVLLVWGALGYLMVKGGLPLAPLILGLILGDEIEKNFIRAIQTDSNPWLFVTRPISGLLFALSVLSVAYAVWQHHRQRARANGRITTDSADF